MRFVHTPNAICATTETGRVSGAILKRPPKWSSTLWDRLAPQVCELLSAIPRGMTCADLVAEGYLQPLPPGTTHIPLTKAEVSSGYNRVQWAEDLIRQLPEAHEGRNSWLMNYGRPVTQGSAEVIPEPARAGFDDRDTVIAELRSALTATQRAVGEAQTETRQLDLGEFHLRALLMAPPNGGALHDPKAKVWVRRV